ncbi:sigma-70 family RNA polymerase sigma factor [Aquimarina sp. BL5]|uniref:RNA polymerase sigma factor n=1 Tax=Aquimarina sp. BL5 TaxID=1714860 RepID=UPI000E4D4305|nr:sigma-70 family RNA polymerase sigma factor [Aquimarina sp. BL5]AXT51158.1 sigma-70 family RNA polymerase sigma factor [Aquimarina sp. BL5]RKM98565.1 sigma-70 family RNA polymerase sigma factor [Aquimarina sp. BL5]
MSKDNTKIITAFINDDDKVIKEFYQKNLPVVSIYVTQNHGNQDDAKDVFQDAMIIIYEKIKTNTLDIKCALGTYVCGISRNLWRNRLRKDNKLLIKTNIIIPDIEEEKIPIEYMDKMDKIFLIQKHLLKLGEGCKEILLLFFSGYHIRDIAVKRNLTEAYTRKRKFMCQKKLTGIIEKDPIFRELKESYKSK